jgi:protein gp37
MADTAIEWASKVWNPVVGCSLQSPGCTNCYAMRMAWRLQAMAPKADGTGNYGLTHYEGTVQESRGGPVWTGKVNVAPDDIFLAPLRRRKPTDYFVNSMSDLFHPAVPFEVIDRVFATMALSPQHIFKVLTKRSDRMREYLRDNSRRTPIFNAIADLRRDYFHSAPAFEAVGAMTSLHLTPLPNVWLGVSVEDQTRADERREEFRATPAAVKFVSYEPALGPVDWRGWEFVHQIISGGESGPKARPSHPQWFKDTRDWCAANGVAYFHKQNGEWAASGPHNCNMLIGSDGSVRHPKHRTVAIGTPGQAGKTILTRVGKKAAGRLLDGIEHNGIPEVRA